jgi:hypothetical protein
MALISGDHKIIFGEQAGRGIWFGPIYPNGTKDNPAYPCNNGCLFDIIADPVRILASSPVSFVRISAPGRSFLLSVFLSSFGQTERIWFC